MCRRLLEHDDVIYLVGEFGRTNAAPPARPDHIGRFARSEWLSVVIGRGRDRFGERGGTGAGRIRVPIEGCAESCSADRGTSRSAHVAGPTRTVPVGGQDSGAAAPIGVTGTTTVVTVTQITDSARPYSIGLPGSPGPPPDVPKPIRTIPYHDDTYWTAIVVVIGVGRGGGGVLWRAGLAKRW